MFSNYILIAIKYSIYLYVCATVRKYSENLQGCTFFNIVEPISPINTMCSSFGVAGE